MSDKLKKYNDKRNFEKTDEPKGISNNDEMPSQNLRFVVQHHMSRRNHFDLRLEWNGVLLSWAIPKGISYDPGDKRLAIKVEDHPFEYKDFEGTIPKGEYGGGTVMLWDEGFWLAGSNVDKAMNKGELKFALLGKRLVGEWVLIKLKENNQTNNWLLIKERDKYAKVENGISGYITSIRSGRTMDEIGAEEID